MRKFAPIILRIGLSLVFLWFGSQQIINTNEWVTFIPNWITSLSGISASFFVYLNGSFEIIFGLFLLTGYFTRVTAFLLAFHMIDIAFVVGYSSIGIRDFGLSVATISVFLYGPDSWSIDYLLEKNNQSDSSLENI